MEVSSVLLANRVRRERESSKEEQNLAKGNFSKIAPDTATRQELAGPAEMVAVCNGSKCHCIRSI